MARGSGAAGPRSLAGWHAALELGARGGGFGWLARSSGAGGSHSLDGRHAAQELGARMEFGWVSWGPTQSLDGWHAAQELGELGPAEFGWVARGFGAGRPRF